MLLATGIPARDALTIVIASVIIILGGASIYSSFTNQKRLSFSETIGGGFTVGTAIPALSIFFVGELGLRSAISTWIWAVILLAGAFYSFNPSRQQIKVGSVHTTQLALVPMITMLGYHAWAPLLWPYLIGYSLTITVGFVLAKTHRWRNKTEERRFRVKTLLGAPILALLLQLAIQYQWKVGKPYLYLGGLTDNIYDEVLAWSVSRYGYAENPFFVGHQINGYLLTNSWAGNLYEALGSRPFALVSSFGVIASLASVLFIVVALCERHQLNHRIAHLAIILAGLQASFGELFPFSEPPRIQHALGLAWLMLSILLIEKYVEQPTILTSSFITLIAFSVALGKTQMFIVTVALFIVGSVTAAVKDRTFRPVLIALASVVGMLYFYVFASNHYFGERSNPWILYWDPDTITEWVVPILITITTRTFLPLSVVGKFGRHGNYFPIRVAAIGLPAVLAYALLHDANALRHVLAVSLLLGAVASAPLVRHMLDIAPRGVKATCLGLGFGFGAWLFAQGERSIILNFPSDSKVRLLALDAPAFTQIGFIVGSSLLIAPLTLAFHRWSRSEFRFPIRWVAISCIGILVLGANIGMLVGWTTRHEIRGLIALEKGDSWPNRGQGPEPSIPPLEWIRKTTTKEAIVANNLLCKGLPATGYIPRNGFESDCVNRNMSAIVAAFSQRRSYIDGPYQAFIRDELLGIANLRYRDSILFATNNDPNSFSRMVSDGVDYFVVDLGQTPLRDWEPHGSIRFRDKNYAVIELNE